MQSKISPILRRAQAGTNALYVHIVKGLKPHDWEDPPAN